MKIYLIVIICVLMTCCSSGGYLDNQKMIASIDSLGMSKIISKVETDSIGNILDTISIESLKFDKEGRRRYKEVKYRFRDEEMSCRDYFKLDEDLFFRKCFDHKGEVMSTFETTSNKDGIVVSAIQIEKGMTSIDTIFMDYSHFFYLNGKVKKLIIKIFSEEVGEVSNKVIYDKEEKPLFELTIMNEDTISVQTWEYTGEILEKSILLEYRIDTSKLVYYFAAEKPLLKEEEFEFVEGRFIKWKETTHFYNESKDRIKSIESNTKKKQTRYIQYLNGIGSWKSDQ